MPNQARRALLFAAVALSIAGCASSPNYNPVTTWRDPDFKGPPFRKVFVVGLSAQDLSDQRGFENLLVSTLQGAQILAVPGWQYVATDRPPDQATMRAAVAKSGADAVLLVRPSGFSTESQVGLASGVMVEGAPGVYAGWYQPYNPLVVTESVRVATIYTTLFDVRTARPVWTFNSPTYDPASLRKDAPAYANDVAGLLQGTGLFAGP
ncbi:MAG: hypothetical protein ABI537_06450 [Casimicrobiaceae bacterium]